METSIGTFFAFDPQMLSNPPRRELDKVFEKPRMLDPNPDLEKYMETFFQDFQVIDTLKRRRLVCSVCLAPIEEDQFIVLPHPQYPEDPSKVSYFHSKRNCSLRSKKVKTVRGHWLKTRLQQSAEVCKEEE
ncbi:MAG: hypothetical protein EAX86_11655 [Candidatus Heimdallarchaeota archaeon]|nr:hypothetical protein [Candidatus Heimdallarchaeota archaeon]